ncbi:MAG: SAF domain-containing protein [Actinomycetota bacterium]|nr:SAF domain-containing protein [Actinomycetota bacterium]
MVATSPKVAPAQEVPPDSTPARQGLLHQLSLGHWLMIVAGLLAAVVNFAVLRAGDNSRWVAIASEDIRPGQKVTPDIFRLTKVHAGDEVLGPFLTQEELGDVAGRVANRPIAAGALVTEGDLSARGSETGLRWMSIPIDPAHAAGGALTAGDRVDVVQVVDGRVQLVAIGAEVVVAGRPDDDGFGGLSQYAITLAVDVPTMLRIAAGIHGDAIEVVRSTGADPPLPVPAQPAGSPQAPGA